MKTFPHEVIDAVTNAVTNAVPDAAIIMTRRLLIPLIMLVLYSASMASSAPALAAMPPAKPPFDERISTRLPATRLPATQRVATRVGATERSTARSRARSTTQPGPVSIKVRKVVRLVHTKKYEATIADDGCLTSLRVGGLEFFHPTAGVSRGSYFYQRGVLKLPTIAQQSSRTIRAMSHRARIRYEFGADTLTWHLSNTTDETMSFFIIFDPAVNVVLDENAKYARPPVRGFCHISTWFRGRSRLRLTGAAHLWGPWEQAYQVWEASLAPHESRQITLQIGHATPAEVANINARVTATQPHSAAHAELTKNSTEDLTENLTEDLTLAAPRDYQVFQRRTRWRGHILVNGRVQPACDTVQVRVTGTGLTGPLVGGWYAVPLSERTHSFSAEVFAPAGGWYKVEVQALKNGTPVAQASVDHVGVGEVFVGAGQSNEANSGEQRLSPASGMVSTFSGHGWRLAYDPQPGTHDGSGGGSFWPAFGDAMYEKFKVPIGIASTGHGATNIGQWQPDGELFNWMMMRVHELGYEGFRALLWHQGESDVGLPAADYAQRLGNVIRASQMQAGWAIPWFVAQVSYLNPAKPLFQGPRVGQKKLWDIGLALPGPDTDTLTGAYRDKGGRGIHFNARGQIAHGQMWAAKVAPYVEAALDEAEHNGAQRLMQSREDANVVLTAESDSGGSSSNNSSLGSGYHLAGLPIQSSVNAQLNEPLPVGSTGLLFGASLILVSLVAVNRKKSPQYQLRRHWLW